MHLWDIDALGGELRTGKLTESQSFKYFMVVVLVQAIPILLPVRDEAVSAFFTMGFAFLAPLVWLATLIAGLIICFKANQQSDGIDFIRRFICLEVPAMIRTLAFCVPGLIILTLLIGPFVQKGQAQIVGFIEGCIYIEVLGIVQFFIIYRRLRGVTNLEAGTKGAIA
jgi:hypothetical protein